ncbi:hypothetical protein H8B15_18410 [Hymenobacter sp. BT507]|uniref:Lipoprotein n=1 Tax=Hymenobacter citatus TaxID=2763506 RepID=A0ABR7MP84_9BACT|nr:hypothetical protein [Hymenobacter citatus]MBC6612902.1 hypothetical protein [Hymenobacter citatus]
MLLLRFSFVCLVFFVLLDGCSLAPSTIASYPNNPTASDEQGRPLDSAVFYFPAVDSLPLNYIPHNKRSKSRSLSYLSITNCAFELAEASNCLVYFQAPVLSNYYLKADIYRFLWLRSFDRPVLVTLQRKPVGTTLCTQFLSKYPVSAHLTVPDPEEPGISAEQVAQRLAALEDPVFKAYIAEEKRPSVLVDAEETTVAVTPEQWQHFERLLQKADFWQLPACQPLGLLDGAEWLLEAHQANRYHMVLRQSPREKDAFRISCEYLLNLSSARKEKRY